MELFKEMLIRILEENPDLIFFGETAKELVELKSFQTLQQIKTTLTQKTPPTQKIKKITQILNSII